MNHTQAVANENKGFFIVAEGLDGSGKTSLTQKMANWFEGEGFEVVLTREPGGTKLAEYIRSALKHNAHGDEPIDPDTEMMLFNAARIHHVNNVIRPALAAGKVVLCDRFADSTFAYQGAGRGLDIGKLMKFHHDYVKLYPDITFLLDGDPMVFRERMIGRGKFDRFDELAIEFAQRVRKFYLQQAEQSSDIYEVVDATQPEEAVFPSVVESLQGIKKFLREPDPIEFVGV